MAMVAVAVVRGHGRAVAGEDAGAEQSAGRPIDLDSIVASACTKHKVPGMAAAGIKEGALWGIGAAGVRRMGQGARVTENDLWYLGSCGRAMTATLAAVLVERGSISWDSTVGEVLPQVAEVAREAYRGVTLAQLLQGRSGLPADPSASSPLWRLVRGAEGTMVERRIAVAKIALRQEAMPVGHGRSRDSGLGYVVAGAMLEAACGAPFEELMRRDVFAPLGMDSAGFGVPGRPGVLDEPLGHASGFGGWLRPVPPADGSYPPEVMAPAGTVHCSIGDWAKFAVFTLRGARGGKGLLISPESFRVIQSAMMRRDRVPMGWELTARSWAGGVALVHEERGNWYASIWVGPTGNVAYLVAGNRGDDEGELAGNEVLGAMIDARRAGVEGAAGE